MKVFGIYMLAINVITWIAYGVDKYKAKHNHWRIPERTLIGMAALGGFIGAFVGMQMFRHKTKHLKFVIGIPVIAILWILTTIIIYNIYI